MPGFNRADTANVQTIKIITGFFFLLILCKDFPCSLKQFLYIFHSKPLSYINKKSIHPTCVPSKVLANPEEHSKGMYAPFALEHTSRTAVPPISKGCKFFDSDGGNFFNSNCQMLFSVPEITFHIKVFCFNSNLAQQNNICNSLCKLFRFLPEFANTCFYTSKFRANSKTR